MFAAQGLAVRPIDRWIKEVHRLEVFVRDYNLDHALKVLKKQMNRQARLA
jgi:hypothetical protein